MNKGDIRQKIYNIADEIDRASRFFEKPNVNGQAFGSFIEIEPGRKHPSFCVISAMYAQKSQRSAWGVFNELRAMIDQKESIMSYLRENTGIGYIHLTRPNPAESSIWEREGFGLMEYIVFHLSDDMGMTPSEISQEIRNLASDESISFHSSAQEIKDNPKVRFVDGF